MSDLEKQARRIQRLRTTNAGLMGEIERYGGSVDLSMARIEHLVGELVELGVLTQEQQLNEAENWEVSLRTQLIPVRDRVRDDFQARRAQRMRLAERKQAAEQQKTEKPNSGIILPK